MLRQTQGRERNWLELGLGRKAGFVWRCGEVEGGRKGSLPPFQQFLYEGDTGIFLQ